MTRLPKVDEVWSCGDATATVLAVHAGEVARTSTGNPDGIVVDDLDYFIRHFTPPTAPVPSGMPTVLRIHPDEIHNKDSLPEVRAYVGPDHLPACGNRSGLLRYVLDTERPWEVEPS